VARIEIGRTGDLEQQKPELGEKRRRVEEEQGMGEKRRVEEEQGMGIGGLTSDSELQADRIGGLAHGLGNWTHDERRDVGTGTHGSHLEDGLRRRGGALVVENRIAELNPD
jgi:hypothetical protein